MRKWLAVKSRRTAVFTGLASSALLALGAVALYVAFWFFYGFLRYGTALLGIGNLLGAHSTCLVISGVFVGLLFLGQIAIVRKSLDHYEFETGPSQLISLSLAQATGYSFLSLAAGPKTALSFVKLLIAILGIGPAMVVEAYRQAIRSLRLFRLDVNTCAPIMATLFDADAKVPFVNLFQKHPAADPERIVRDLQTIDGVLFRTSAPPGLSLAAHLRDEIIAARSKAGE